MTFVEKSNVIDAVTNCDNDLQYYNEKEELLDTIRNIPSMEIVFCKDCKNRRTLDCPFGITIFDWPKDNNFCSCGER